MQDKKQWLTKALAKIDSMTREEFIESLDRAGFFNEIVRLDPKETPYPVEEGFGDLITRAEYEEFDHFYDSYYASDGKVYWHIDPVFKDSSHVLCLSK